MNSRITKSKEEKTFCKICYQAGRPRNEYINHNTRAKNQPNAIIQCPILLKSHCKYCNEKGHSMGSCILYKKRISQSSTIPPPNHFRKNSSFTSSSSSSSFDELLEKIKKEEEKMYSSQEMYDIGLDEDEYTEEPLSSFEKEEEKKVNTYTYSIQWNPKTRPFIYKNDVNPCISITEEQF